MEIEQQSKELQNNFENVEKNISEVLKTLQTNCEAWDSCVDILKHINENRNILLSFNNEDIEENEFESTENLEKKDSECEKTADGAEEEKLKNNRENGGEKNPADGDECQTEETSTLD